MSDRDRGLSWIEIVAFFAFIAFVSGVTELVDWLLPSWASALLALMVIAFIITWMRRGWRFR